MFWDVLQDTALKLWFYNIQRFFFRFFSSKFPFSLLISKQVNGNTDCTRAVWFGTPLCCLNCADGACKCNAHRAYRCESRESSMWFETRYKFMRLDSFKIREKRSSDLSELRSTHRKLSCSYSYKMQMSTKYSIFKGLVFFVVVVFCIGVVSGIRAWTVHCIYCPSMYQSFITTSHNPMKKKT